MTPQDVYEQLLAHFGHHFLDLTLPMQWMCVGAVIADTSAKPGGLVLSNLCQVFAEPNMLVSAHNYARSVLDSHIAWGVEQ